MCTGLEIAALVGTIASVAGTVTSGVAAKKQQKAQVDARNATLARFLDKNEDLSAEAREVLKRRLDQENIAPQEQLDPLQAVRQEAGEAAVDRASAPIPLSGSVPQVVANRASEAQENTTAGAKRRAEALAGARSFGDLLFEKGLATNAAGRDIGTITGFAGANASRLPSDLDLAQLSKAGVGNTLGTVGGIGSALGSLATTAAGSGGFGLGGNAATIKTGATAQKVRPINLGFN